MSKSKPSQTASAWGNGKTRGDTTLGSNGSENQTKDAKYICITLTTDNTTDIHHIVRKRCFWSSKKIILLAINTKPKRYGKNPTTYLKKILEETIMLDGHVDR